MLFSLWSSYGKNTYEYTVRLLISKNLCAMYWTVSNYFSFKKIFRRKIILNMWNVKMNVWLINFFATPKFYSFWWLLFPWILLEKVCAWGWRPLRLETDIEKKIKTKKATLWRDRLTFPFRCHLYSKCYCHYSWGLQWWRARCERCL